MVDKGKIDLWGFDKIRQVEPPDEVVERVLADMDIARDYPKVYEQARQLKEKRQGKESDNGNGD